MDFISLTIDVLKVLAQVAGSSYGWGIILLTILIRVIMWPLGVSQQRSMRNMQILQPKMKLIQERYKSNPTLMQQKLMEFYKTHKFNPMAGCWPLLIQMPIFILLYSALMSPAFIQTAGNDNFFFIKRLDSTLKGNAGISYDNEFSVSSHDTFASSKMIKVYFDNDTAPIDLKIKNPRKLIKVQGDITPGETLDLKISLDDLDLKYAQLEKIKTADVEVVDNTTREVEKVKFSKRDTILTASVPTKSVQSAFHYDVLILIILFGATMFITQKIMMATNKNQALDPTQEAMQKTLGTMMPAMLMVTFIFIPIPAGVLLYLITSNIFQVIQTLFINKQLELEDNIANKNKTTVSKDSVDDTKIIEAKEVKNIEIEEKNVDKKGKKE